MDANVRSINSMLIFLFDWIGVIVKGPVEGLKIITCKAGRRKKFKYLKIIRLNDF